MRNLHTTLLFIALALHSCAPSEEQPTGAEPLPTAKEEWECHYFNNEKMLHCQNAKGEEWEQRHSATAFIPVGRRQLLRRDGGLVIRAQAGGAEYSIGDMPRIPLALGDSCALWVWPSRPDAEGRFAACMDCPAGTKREYLKAHLLYQKYKEGLRAFRKE